MTFPVDVVLKGRDYAVTESVTVPHGEPSTWNDAAVRDVLIEILRAIDRAQNPGASADRVVALQGFSWIVEPDQDKVVIAIEIPMGAAVAGPFAIPQAELDASITRVLKIERELFGPQTVH
ncbi:MAG: hypothetical protein R2752_19495 [Vicinamibacterales bacterium]